MDHQVERKLRFLAGHPEWRILSPDEPRSQARREVQWRALGPAGLIRANHLYELLDDLEQLTRPAGGNDGRP